MLFFQSKIIKKKHTHNSDIEKSKSPDFSLFQNAQSNKLFYIKYPIKKAELSKIKQIKGRKKKRK